MVAIGQYARLTALVLITAGTLVLVGCGGGGDGDPVGTTGTVTGTVKYLATLQPLGDILVAVGAVSTRTGANGSFTLQRVPEGTRTLAVSADPARGLALPPGVPLTVVVTADATTALPEDILMIDSADLPPQPPS